MASTPKNVERAAQIVGVRGQAEIGAHVGKAARQDGVLVHPLLDAAEWALDDLAAPVEILWHRFEALGRAILGEIWECLSLKFDCFKGIVRRILQRKRLKRSGS